MNPEQKARILAEVMQLRGEEAERVIEVMEELLIEVKTLPAAMLVDSDGFELGLALFAFAMAYVRVSRSGGALSRPHVRELVRSLPEQGHIQTAD